MSKLCSICGTEIPEGEEFEYDGQVYCRQHFDELFTTCDNCGAIVRREDLTHTSDDKDVCEDCLSIDYFLCSYDEDYHPNSEGYWVVNPGRYDEQIIADSNWRSARGSGDLFYCDSCADWFTDNHLSMSDSSTCICDDCDADYYTCSDCGCIVHSDDVYWDDNDDPYCEDCFDNRRSRAIHDYGFKPLPIFGTTDSRDGRTSYDGDELTFGVELECDKGENPSEAAQEICDLTDRVYCKHDGSLCDGYEVVTHPGTLAWHMNVFPWADICRISREHGFSSHDAETCGLHIHIGVDQLGNKRNTLGKLILLCTTLYPELYRFSRRTNTRWACRNEGIDELKIGLKEDAALDRVVRASESQGRYTFVNVCNSSTVELRFNRGTLKLPTIYACLQLASNLALFARDHSIDEVLDAKWDDVVHSYEYEELTAYVNERFAGFIVDEATRPTTDYRTTAVPAPAPTSSGFGTNSDIVTRGCVLEDIRSTSDLFPGDLVVRTMENTNDGPRVGDIGVVISGNAAPAVWNTVNPAEHGMDHVSNTDYPARQWRSSASMMQVIRTLRNGDAPDRAANLTGAERGFVPGMRVHHVRMGDGTLLRLTLNCTGRVIAHVSWDRYSGHNDGGMVDDHSAWNFLLDDIVALN